MIEDMRIVDIDQRYNRAIAIGRTGNETVFGLAIRRQERDRTYWCFYMSVTRAQFEVLNRHMHSEEDPGFSFLGIGNPTISVPELLCDKFLLEPPVLWTGIHVDQQAIGLGTGDEIIAFLVTFCNSILEMVEKSPCLS